MVIEHESDRPSGQLVNGTSHIEREEKVEQTEEPRQTNMIVEEDVEMDDDTVSI